MQKLFIKGKKFLSGSISVSGSKNATLPILAASILNDQKTVIKNIPFVKDVFTMIELLNFIGLSTEIDKKKKILKIKKNKKKIQTVAPYKIVKTSWMLGKSAHLSNKSAIRIRNMIMKLTPDFGAYVYLWTIEELSYSQLFFVKPQSTTICYNFVKFYNFEIALVISSCPVSKN